MPASTNHPAHVWENHPNPYVRLLGRDASASTLLRAMANIPNTLVRLTARPENGQTDNDYTQIDVTLPLTKDEATAADPLPNTSYAGMTPVQRRRFANWLTAPEIAAPTAFRQIYLAWLESALFEPEKQAAVVEQISALLNTGGWKQDAGLARVGLLAGWLTQHSATVASALAHGCDPLSLSGVGAGWLAHWGVPLNAECAVALAQAWNLHIPALAGFQAANDGPLLELRITSLANSLGADPMAWALAQARENDESTEWLPWYCTHRGLRLLLPQWNVRPFLEPRLADLLASMPVTVAQPHLHATNSVNQVDGSAPVAEWSLLLEFGASRSQHYDYVTHLARKQSGYQLLMDETRQLIHRIHFRKRHIRQFWRLWAYVENWSSTRVYVNGDEIQKWNVYPYSAEMR